MFHLSWALPALIVGVAASAVGCRHHPQGAVSGEVVLDDRPIQLGMVTFEPIDAKASPRTVILRDGKYEAMGRQGLTPGSYLVRITAPNLAEATRNSTQGDGFADTVRYCPLLPPSWNTESKLSVQVRAGRNRFHFRGNANETPTVETPSAGR